MSAYDRLRDSLHGYPTPSFEELVHLCRDFGLVTEYRPAPSLVRLRCIDQVFELDFERAEVLLQGLLLGYFFGRSPDDLSLASWAS